MMGKPNMFQISFANASAVFYPCDKLEGYVTIELIQAMEMKGINLRFLGKANTHISEERKNRTAHYWGKEKYFDETKTVLGAENLDGDNSELSVLPAGRHTFPFEYELPEYMGCSFESSDASVRYSVTCTIQTPGRFEYNHTTKRMFTVNNHYDLNELPEAKESGTLTDYKHLCCCCCKSPPITGTIFIDHCGYVPGETVKIFGTIENRTSRTMNKSYVKLIMVITIRANYKIDLKTKELARVSRPAIPGYGEDSWEGEELIIPPLPPSCLRCNIIDIDYFLVLTVSPAGMSMDLEVPIPIILGTIPLESAEPRTRPHQDQGEPVQAGYPIASPLSYPDLPPPSYEECITGRINVKDDDDEGAGGISFAPSYIYYNRSGCQPGLAQPVKSGTESSL